MTTITELDRNACLTISKAAQEALQAVAEQFGLNLTMKGGKYDPASGTFTPKVEFSVAGSAGKEWANTVRFLSSNHPAEWLTAEDFGATITSQGKTYELVGINLRAPKFPINAKCLSDGKTYKLTEAGVKRAMGR
jgi:hypothetical protein